MKLIKRVKGLKDFYLHRGQEVRIYKDKICVGDKELKAEPDDDFFEENGNLTKCKLGKSGTRMLYNNGVFEEEKLRYLIAIYFAPDVYYSKMKEGNVFKYSFMENGTEYLFEIESEKSLSRIEYNPGNSVLMIPTSGDRQLLFYTKTGERLWVYDEEEIVEVGGLFLSANEEIFESKEMKIVRFPSVVDDVVVIISRIITEGICKAQGFKIRTGEKLWELRDEICPYDLFEGDDKMLYGCLSIYDELVLCRLDPFTGKFDKWAVKSDKGISVCSWNVSMHNNRLYYGSNRPGCEFGIIDCGKKELVESVFLGLEEGYQIGAPIVSDGKVYVFGGGELRVYEL
jgi:hypothetical protein